MAKPEAPPHMDKPARNERLVARLMALGLYVEPVYREAVPDDIDYLIVSSGLPDRHSS